MNALTKCFTIIFIALVTLSGCDDDIEGPIEVQDGKIRGTIIDSTGNPVANVPVSIVFTPCLFGAACTSSSRTIIDKKIGDSKLLELSSANDVLLTPFPNPFDFSTSIMFRIEDTTSAKIWITRFCDEDTIEVLIDDILVPGDYQSLWTIRNSMVYNYISGGYYVNMVSANYSEKILAIVYNTEGDTKTDADGSFILEQECLPFGSQYGMTGPASPDIEEIVNITRYIGFFVKSTIDNFVVFDSIFVDSLEGTDVILELK